MGFEDEFYPIFAPPALAAQTTSNFVAEWILGAMNGELDQNYERKGYIRKSCEVFFC